MIVTFSAPDPEDLIIEDDVENFVVYFTDEGTISALEIESVTYDSREPDERRQALREGGREALRRAWAGSLRSAPRITDAEWDQLPDNVRNTLDPGSDEGKR